MILTVRKYQVFIPDNCLVTIKELKEVPFLKSIKNKEIINLIKQSAKQQKTISVEYLRRAKGILIINKNGSEITVINNSYSKDFIEHHSSFLRKKIFSIKSVTLSKFIELNPLKKAEKEIIEKKIKPIRGKRNIYLDIENVSIRKAINKINDGDTLNIIYSFREAFDKGMKKIINYAKQERNISINIYTTKDKTKNAADRLILEKAKECKNKKELYLISKDRELRTSFQKIIKA